MSTPPVTADVKSAVSVGIEDVRAAAERIQPYIHRTPVLTCKALDAVCEAELFFKCENFQRTGSFKFRGASNAVGALAASALEKGVATHSSGNHGAALARAAVERGAKAWIVMPENAPRAKQEAVASYGGEIIHCPADVASREAYIADVLKRTGATFVHPYNNVMVVAGQGTAALELCEQAPDLDVVITPVGGGGLLSGTALTLHALQPGTAVLAGEPQGADDAYRSLQADRIIPMVDPNTIADGLLTSLGEITFPVIRSYVSEIVTVDEAAIVDAMRRIWQRMKIVVEPSAAVPLAALLARPDLVAGKRVGIVLSGGNLDLDKLPW